MMLKLGQQVLYNTRNHIRAKNDFENFSDKTGFRRAGHICAWVISAGRAAWRLIFRSSAALTIQDSTMIEQYCLRLTATDLKY